MSEQPTGDRRQGEQEPDATVEREVVRREGRLDLDTEAQDVGRLRVRKQVWSYPVEQVVPRNVEDVDGFERIPAAEDDSGEIETLPDGSVSIPVFEEVLVVTKRLVVRERVVVRKGTVVDEYTLRTDLRREHVEVDDEGDGDVSDGSSHPTA